MPASIRQLRAFRAVISYGSITRASDALHLTQPALSKQIAALEAQLRLTLFKRHRGGPMIPTKEGLAFYKSIEPTLFGLDAIPDIAQEIKDGIRLRLRIVATPPVINSPAFLQGLRLFQPRRPEVHFSLEARPRVDIENYIADGRADIGIGLLPISHPEIRSKLLVNSGVFAIVPRDHSFARKKQLALSDLSGVDLILPTKQLLRERIDSAMPNLFAKHEASSSITCAVMAAHRLGIALCDPFSPDILGTNQFVKIPINPRIKLEYGVILPRSESNKNIALDLANSLKQSFKSRNSPLTTPKP